MARERAIDACYPSRILFAEGREGRACRAASQELVAELVAAATELALFEAARPGRGDDDEGEESHFSVRRAEQRGSPAGQFRTALVFAFYVHYDVVYNEEKRKGHAFNRGF